mmetsp:Transcript_18248/g.44805  ORF Transcript_18248/g.44805 Transcript_18248/m.44805 type:complete len:911 (+) Transcript_18248:84-2816(+)
MKAEHEDQLQHLEMALQRHVNLLREPNKVKRRRAIKHISQSIEEILDRSEDAKQQEDSEGWKAVCRNLFYNTVGENLIDCIQDASEKPREISVTLCRQLLPILNLENETKGEKFFQLMVKSLHHQIGSCPQNEPSEEVRLFQLQLTIDLVDRAPKFALAAMDQLIGIATSSCADAYPEVKVTVSSLFRGISKELLSCESLQASTCEKVAGRLSAACLPNMKHQRSKVRTSALECFSSILLARGSLEQWSKEALSQIAKLTMDRTSAVRIQLCKHLGTWLQELKLERSGRSQLVLLLLTLASDEDDSCKEEALEAFCRLGTIKEMRGKILADRKLSEDSSLARMVLDCDGDESKSLEGKEELPAQKGRISGIIPALCAIDICPQILNQLDSWTAQDRYQASNTLLTLLNMAKGELVPMIKEILTSLVKHMTDMEDPAFKTICLNLESIGKLLPPEAWLEQVFKSLESQAEGSHSSWLSGLEKMLQGSMSIVEKKELVRKQFAPRLARIISRRTISLSDDRPSRFYARSCLQSLLAHFEGSPRLEDVPVSDVFWSLLQLHSKVETRDEFEKLEKVVSKLGSIMQQFELESGAEGKSGTAQSLASDVVYNHQFMSALRRVLHPHTKVEEVDFENDSEQTRLLVTLLRRAATVVHHYLPAVMPLLTKACGSVDNDPRTRIHILSLLLQLLNSSRRSSWNSHASQIVERIVLPNMVWRSGDTALTIRHTAIKILARIFQQVSERKCRQDIARHLGKSLEVLETCLDDDDARVRLIMAQGVFTPLLSMEDPVLDELQLSKLYPKLTDRLDDSDDSVRIATTSALRALICCALPPAEAFDRTGQAFTYIVKHSLIHLDDSETKICDAVFEFLRSVSFYNPKVFVELVADARSRHTTPQRCDALLKCASDSSVDVDHA